MQMCKRCVQKLFFLDKLAAERNRQQHCCNYILKCFIITWKVVTVEMEILIYMLLLWMFLICLKHSVLHV